MKPQGKRKAQDENHQGADSFSEIENMIFKGSLQQNNDFVSPLATAL